MGKIVQNYNFQEELGRGIFSTVYRAVNTKTQEIVAIKMIRSDRFTEVPKLFDCTTNEINILKRMEYCPHIIRYFDMFKTVNNFYFVYEYCNQGTLEAQLKLTPQFSEAKAVGYLLQIIEAFKVLNKHMIMHRDLKPENVLLHDGVLKLADFGFCKLLQNKMDTTATMLGSPIYMAPEILMGKSYTIKTDVWSLGVLLYRMLYGYCPFQSSSIGQLINIIRNEQMQIPETPVVSPHLVHLMRRMLTKDSALRADWNQIFKFDAANAPNPFKDSFLSTEPTAKRPLRLEDKPDIASRTTKNILQDIKPTSHITQEDYHQEIKRQYMLNDREHSKFNISKKRQSSKDNQQTKSQGNKIHKGSFNLVQQSTKHETAYYQNNKSASGSHEDSKNGSGFIEGNKIVGYKSGSGVLESQKITEYKTGSGFIEGNKMVELMSAPMKQDRNKSREMESKNEIIAKQGKNATAVRSKTGFNSYNPCRVGMKRDLLIRNHNKCTEITELAVSLATFQMQEATALSFLLLKSVEKQLASMTESLRRDSESNDSLTLFVEQSLQAQFADLRNLLTFYKEELRTEPIETDKKDLLKSFVGLINKDKLEDLVIACRVVDYIHDNLIIRKETFQKMSLEKLLNNIRIKTEHK